MEQMQRFKVVLVGDGGVGKTTLVHRHLTGQFRQKYIPTLGVEDVTPLSFHTNYGNIIFDIWDTAGQEKYSGLYRGYAVDVDAVIGVCDLTSKISAKNLSKWYHEMGAYLDCVASVAVGNKCDIPNPHVTNNDKIALHKQWGTYFDVSAKSNNFEKPFLHLARVLTGKDDLEFI